MSVALVRWRVRFTGRVQHVGFRWVDNLPDGRVELEAQGGVAQLRQLVIRLKSQPHIHIDRVEIEEIPVLPHERGCPVRGY